MAKQGYYEDPPSRRFAYDKDGTTVLYSNFGARPSIYGQTFKNTLNESNEDNTFTYGNGGSYGQIIFYFPELRNITHYQLGLNSAQFSVGVPGYIEVSTDTTNGVDGNWLQVQGNLTSTLSASAQPASRNSITTLSGANNIRAIRYSFTYIGSVALGYVGHLHLYGYFGTAQTPDRIDFTDSFAQPLIIDFDYGDQPNNIVRKWTPDETWNQGSPLFVRNHSTNLTAEDVYIDFSSNDDNMSNYMTISSDDVTYGSFLLISELAPGQSFGPIWLRHSPNSGETLGVHDTRLQIDVGSWT